MGFMFWPMIHSNSSPRAVLGCCLALVLAISAVADAETQVSALELPSIFAVRDNDKLCLILDDRDTVLAELGGVVEGLTLSPDGRFVTLFKPVHSGSDILGIVPGSKPFSSNIEVDLVLIDRYAQSSSQLGEVKFRRPYWSVGTVYGNFMRPVWLDDCQRLYVPSRDEVRLAHVDGTVDSILFCKKLTSLTGIPNSTRCAASSEKAVFVVDTQVALTETLVDTAMAKEELGGTIRALACSRDGRYLAVGHGKTLSVVGIDDRQIRRWGKAPGEIYWAAWLPNDTGIVVLSGSEDERVSFQNSVYPASVSTGSIAFHVITPNVKKSRKLYDQVDYDVRRANPSMSPDGRFIVFTSRKNMARGSMMVLPLDGGKAIRLTEHYLYEWPVWGPQ